MMIERRKGKGNQEDGTSKIREVFPESNANQREGRKKKRGRNWKSLIKEMGSG